MKNLLAFLSVSFLTFSIFAADPVQREVSVGGECNHMVSPDRGSITLTVEYQNMNLSKAANDTSQSYERVSAAVKKLKLNNLNVRTSEYSVNQIVEWEKDHQVMKGYRVRMGLWVSTSDIKRLGEVIEIASDEKVKNVNSLQTYLSEEKQTAEEISCLQEATLNARTKADKLATSLGEKLGPVISVNLSGISRPSPRQPMMDMMMARSMAKAEMAPPSVEAGEQNLSLSVQVTFGLK